MLKLTRKNESGRSMIEMLGVLAIIGVLSVGGIAGYTTAMNSHYANQAVDQARRLAAVASSKRLINPAAYLIAEELEGNFTMDETETGHIKLTVTGLSEAVRNRIKGMDLGIATAGDGEVEGSLVFTFNNDLSEGGSSGNCWQKGTCKETDVDPDYEQWCFNGIHSNGGFCSCAESAGPENCIEQDGTYPTCRAEGKSAAYCDCMKWRENPSATDIAICECLGSGKSDSCCNCTIGGGQPEADCPCT